MSDYQEMLSPDIFSSSRRQPWQEKISFRDLLTDETDLTEEQIKEKGVQIAARLKSSARFMEHTDAEDVVYELENATNLDDFNEWLTQVWDICDDQRIWIKFKGEK